MQLHHYIIIAIFVFIISMGLSFWYHKAKGGYTESRAQWQMIGALVLAWVWPVGIPALALCFSMMWVSKKLTRLSGGQCD